MRQIGDEIRQWGDVPAGNGPHPILVESENAREIVESMRVKGTTEIKLEIFFGYLSVKPKTHTQILKSLGNRDE
jgi:hypothetical protein